jgi:hypothetical protein
MTAAFAKADFPEVIRLLDRHFGESTYSLKSLFRDNQRKVLNRILESTLAEAEAGYRQIYERHAPLMRFLNDLSMPLNDLSVPLPKALQMAASFILNIDLRRAFEVEAPNLDRVRMLLAEARLWRVELDTAGLAFGLQKTLERMIEQLWTSPTDLSRLLALRASADLVRSLPFELNLWNVQNTYYDLLQRIYPDVLDKADQEDEAAQTWVEHFLALGEALMIRVE